MPRDQRRATTPPQKRCWNCRDRKVACDRATPSCGNCIKKGQQCLGYGLRLSWPKEDDAKRAVTGVQVSKLLPVDAANLQWINATPWDVELHHEHEETGQHVAHVGTWQARNPIPRSLQSSPVSVLILDPDMPSLEPNLVARTIAPETDLYKLLVRMSLNDDSPPALATRHALTSLSYQQLNRTLEARQHQVQALAALQVSIESLQPKVAKEAFQSMAASMLLNIYETMSPEGSSLSWSQFFCGTKRIANLIHKPNSTYEGDLAMILDWIFYHDAMYKFGCTHWVQRIPDQIALAKQPKIVSKAIFSPQRHVILPSLGCSLEMLDVLCQVTDAIWDRNTSEPEPAAYAALLRTLELRLERLEQHLASIDEDTDDATGLGPSSGSITLDDSVRRPRQMAELYRLATQIYLLRCARAAPRSDAKVTSLLDAAFSILRSAGGACERPWPLFVIGLDARDDAERKLVLDLMDAAIRERSRGNLFQVRRMVQAGWTQQDLGGGDGAVDQLFVYNSVVSAHQMPPSFT